MARGPRLPDRDGRHGTAIEARQVHIRRGGRTVLRSVELDLRPGEVVALVGPNGAGKSSLLGAIAGDLPVESGVIRLDGEPIGSWTPVEAAMRRAVLLQSTAIAFPFTVADVVRMGRAPWTGTDAEDLDDSTVSRAMDDADVAGLAGRPVTELSGGERARVALARVLAQGTGVLLLDEPTAALDLHHQERVMEILARRARDGDAVLIVLHDLDLAAAHADVVVILDRESVVASGAPADVLTDELLTDVYQRPIEVLTHPRTGHRMVMPRR